MIGSLLLRRTIKGCGSDKFESGGSDGKVPMFVELAADTLVTVPWPKIATNSGTENSNSVFVRTKSPPLKLRDTAECDFL